MGVRASQRHEQVTRDKTIQDRIMVNPEMCNCSSLFVPQRQTLANLLNLQTTVSIYVYPRRDLGWGPVRSIDSRSNTAPTRVGCSGPCRGKVHDNDYIWSSA